MGIAILILDIIVIVTFLLVLLFAFLRGLPKTIHKIIVLLIPMVLFLILLKPISKGVMEIKIIVPDMVAENLPEEIVHEYLDEPHSIKDIITIVVANSIYDGSVTLKEDSHLATLISSLSEMFVMIFVYLSGISVVFAVRWLLSLITMLLRKVTKIKLEKKQHLLGLALGVVHYAMFFILIFLPIYGVLSLTSTIIKDINYYQQQLDENYTETKVLTDISNEIENSFIKKYTLKPLTFVFCKDKTITLDGQYVGNALSFETPNGNVKFYEEYKHLRNVLDVGIKISKFSENIDSEETKVIKLNDLSDEDFNKISYALRKSQLVRVLIPVVIEVVAYNLEKEYPEYTDIIEDVKSIDWDHDLTKLSSVINSIKEHKNIEIDTTSFDTVLQSDGVKDLSKEVVTKLLELESFDKVIFPLIVLAIYDSLELEQFEEEYNISFDSIRNIDWDNNASSLVTAIFNVYDHYANSDIEFTDFEATLNNPKFQLFVHNVFTEIESSPILTNDIIPFVVQYILIDTVSSEDFYIDIDNLKFVDWKNEIIALKNTLVSLADAYQMLTFDSENPMAVIDNPNLNKYVKDIVHYALNSKILKDEILPNLADDLNEIFASESFSFLSDIITRDSIVTLLTSDVDTLIGILREFKSLGLLEEEATELDFANKDTQQTLIRIIKSVFDLTVIDGKEENIFDGFLETTKIKPQLHDLNVSLNYQNVTSWDQEINNLCDLLTNIMDLSGDLNEFNFNDLLNNSNTLEEKEQVADIVSTFAESQIFGDSIYSLIKDLTNDTFGYELTFTSAEKLIIKNETTWKAEILNLFEVIDLVKPLEEANDYKTLDANQVKQIMLEASETVISAKILGKELNSLLVGVVDADFSKRETLVDYADEVYDAITLAQILNDDDFDLNNQDQVDNLVNSIDNLAKDEQNLDIINDFVNEIISPDVPLDLTKDDITEASTIISDVINTYQNASDQDNFTLDDLSDEQKEAIENSPFADLILDYFF